MGRNLCFLLLVLAISANAQTVYKGHVIDASSGEPIPFVNIGILGGNIGTVSDQRGEFRLEVRSDKASFLDILRFSSLGYRTQEVRLSRLDEEADDLLLRLEPEPIALNEVVLSTSDLFQVEEEIGYPDLEGKGIGYWKDSVALGGELATAILVDEGLRKLNTLFFYVLHNPSDSVRFRINFYKSSSSKLGYPTQNLNESGKNILYTLTGNNILAVVDLEPYDIWIKNDFIVSLELLAVYGTERVSLSLPAGQNSESASYRRYASQASWELIRGSAMGYYLQSTLYTDNERRLPKPRVVRKRQKNEREITGFVFYAGRPLKGANLRNFTTNMIVLTDTKGRYKTKVSKGDILEVSYPGLKPLMVEIEEPRNFNFQLQPR